MGHEIINVYRMEFDSVLKRNEIVKFVGQGVDTEIVILSEVANYFTAIHFF